MPRNRAPSGEPEPEPEPPPPHDLVAQLYVLLTAPRGRGPPGRRRSSALAGS